jgi:hypothetical protein
LLIGFIVYKYIERRKRRKLYWITESQPKVIVSRNDLSSTTIYNVVKKELNSSESNEKICENGNLTVDKTDGKTHILKKKD